MNSAVNELVRSVVARNSLSECSVSELQRLATQYPYFGPVQFLLAQKLREENSPMYKQQSQRAILYFQDQLWFDYLSGDEDNDGIILPVKKEDAAIATEEKAMPSGTPEESITPTGQSFPDDVNIEEEPVADAGPGDLNAIDQEKEKATELADNELTAITSSRFPGTDAAEPAEEQVNPLVSGELNTGSHEQEEEQAPEPPGTPALTLPTFKIEPLPASAAGPVFEPYHTVDYFASQGIRFKEEEKPKDRFGQQLKSFTEWLKALKKSPETEANTTTATPDDQKVVQLAEHSIADRDVVTEAMADVWEQQGNRQKAIAIYQKLSLLNPAKSSYFAAKIEHLKHP